MFYDQNLKYTKSLMVGPHNSPKTDGIFGKWLIYSQASIIHPKQGMCLEDGYTRRMRRN